MMWAVRAYNEWRDNRLNDVINFDVNIFEANLEHLPSLTKDNLQYAMCRFLPEVRKVKSDEDYPGRTLYEMCVAIQKYVNIKGKKQWKLVDGHNFSEMCTVLDNIMKERALRNIGMVRKQAGFIPYNFESSLWEKGLLGEDSPDKLCDTVLFVIGINLGL